MASYNTVPDLESEPLVAAPPRKHGKAMLAVVAALAFGAGALAPSAASRVSQMKLFQTANCADSAAGCAPPDLTQSVGPAGGDDTTPGASKAIETTQTGPYVPGRK